MSKITSLIILAGLIASSGARAGDEVFESFFGQYFQRTDSITIGAGDAKQVNSASEIVDPWPRNVRNRRLQTNGARMVGAVQRYQDVRKAKEAAPPIAPVLGVTTGGGGAAGAQ